MTKKDREALIGPYIRWIADAMGLQDWTFNVVIGQPDSPNNPDGLEWGASCEPVPGRKAATITVAPWLCTADREQLRETVVHELAHCHFFGVWDTVRRDLHGPLGQQTYDVFVAGLERHMEYGIDAVAETIARHMPLIEWPD